MNGDSRDATGLEQNVHDHLLQNLGEDHQVRRGDQVRPRAELLLYSPDKKKNSTRACG